MKRGEFEAQKEKFKEERERNKSGVRLEVGGNGWMEARRRRGEVA